MATTYKILHEDAGRLIVDAEFVSFGEAMKQLGKSKFMDAFLVLDDGSFDITTLAPEEVRRKSIQVIGLTNDDRAH